MPPTEEPRPDDPQSAATPGAQEPTRAEPVTDSPAPLSADSTPSAPAPAGPTAPPSAELDQSAHEAVTGPGAPGRAHAWRRTDQPVSDEATGTSYAWGSPLLVTAEPEPDPIPTVDRLRLALIGARGLALDATRRARITGWLWPLAVTLLAGVLRFWRLGTPHELVFDETYYVKQGWSLLQQGYEGSWADGADALFAAGDGSALGSTAEYVVHPPVGKWVIALGMQLGGGIDSSAAWRLSSAILGTLAVLMVARIGRRLLSSTLLGTLAGLLMAVDGEAIVHSRTGLLDNTVMFFALAAFGALLLDREQARRRLATRTAAIIDAGQDIGWGPRLGWRWWRVAAAVLLGLCIGTKWSGLYFLAVFGLLTVAWDATARRTVGVRSWALATLVKDAIPAGFIMVLTAAGTYLGTWASWFAHPGAYLRQWAAEHPGEGVTWLPESLRSLWKFHTDMWHFHTTLTSEHTYAAHPLGWIVQWRPTSFYYPKSVSTLTGADAQAACGAEKCSQAITSLGNPVIWWLGAAAIVIAVVWLIRRRDWRAGAVLSGIVAGWLPWFSYAERTIFTFYSIAFTPWVILTLVFVLGLLIESPDARQRRRGLMVTAAVVTTVVAVSAFFYPIWTAWVVPYDFWHIHMWLRSWI